MLSDIEISEFLKKHQIRYITKIVEGKGIIFAEIESKNLVQRGLCCFGKRNELIGLQRSMETYAKVSIKNRIRETADLILSDVQFWIEFIKNFVERYDDIALRRQYNDVPNIEHGNFYVSLNKLNTDHLLSIEVNQTMIVTRL